MEHSDRKEVRFLPSREYGGSLMPDKLCQCGHAHEAHTHYRRGSDCAICGADVCGAFSAVRAGGGPVTAFVRPPREKSER